MNNLTIRKLKVILYDAEAMVENIKAMLEEAESLEELLVAEMVTALVTSTDGQRYKWADRFGVDEIQIRRWANGETQPNTEHLKLIRKAYEELLEKKRKDNQIMKEI